MSQLNAQEILDFINAQAGKQAGHTLDQIADRCREAGAKNQVPGYDTVEAEAAALADAPDSVPEPLDDVETDGGGDPANASGDGADAELP